MVELDAFRLIADFLSSSSVRKISFEAKEFKSSLGAAEINSSDGAKELSRQLHAKGFAPVL